MSILRLIEPFLILSHWGVLWLWNETARISKTRKHSSRRSTARLPTICVVAATCVSSRGVGCYGGTHLLHIPIPYTHLSPRRHLVPEIPSKGPGTRDTHLSPERTWDQRYSPHFSCVQTPMKTLPPTNFVIITFKLPKTSWWKILTVGSISTLIRLDLK